MGVLYHGSQNFGLKEIQTHKSTHGNYVYATKNKSLALLFSSHSFDDLLLTIVREDQNEAFALVERVPGVIEKVFNKDSVIYEVDDSSFKDIHTGFDEMVSDTSVKVVKEEHIDNVYQEIKKLSEQNVFRLYQYPNKPNSIPLNDNDLLEKEIEQKKRSGKPIQQDSFDRLLLFHPNLLSNINNYIVDHNLGINTFEKEYIGQVYAKYLSYQMIDEKHDFHLDLAYDMIIKNCPELKHDIDGMIPILQSSREDKVHFMLDSLSQDMDINQRKLLIDREEQYVSDQRSVSLVGKDIIIECKRLKNQKDMVQHKTRTLSKDGFISSVILAFIIIVFILGLVLILK